MTDSMPLTALALLSSASLVAITWPLVATRLNQNLPAEPFLSTNLAAMRPPLGRSLLLGVSNRPSLAAHKRRGPTPWMPYSIGHLASADQGPLSSMTALSK